MDNPEWNSCTDDYFWALEEYYNYPVGIWTEQRSDDVSSVGTVFDWFQTNEDDGCSILDGTPILGGTTLEILEIDPFTPDAPVTDLQVSSGVHWLSCGREGCSPGVTDWGGGSNSVTSASFRLRVVASGLCLDGKGCM